LNLMNVRTVARTELFDKFKEFLLEKNAGETLSLDENSYYAVYEKAAKKAREEAALEKAKQMVKESEKEKEAAKSKQSKPEAKSRNLDSLRGE